MCANLWWYVIPERCLPWHAGRLARLVRFSGPPTHHTPRGKWVVDSEQWAATKPTHCGGWACGASPPDRHNPLAEHDQPVAVGVVVRDVRDLRVAVLQVEPPGRLVVRRGR